MKKITLFIVSIAFLMMGCGQKAEETQTTTTETAAPDGAGQSAVADDVSAKDIVKVAVGSPDHTTLVKAVQAADLVNALSNAGPFTVFAPTNAAFDKVPKETIEKLMKPESKEALQDILQYHVTVAVFEADRLEDGQTLSQVNGGSVKISIKDGKIKVNDANVIASIRASNGVIHVIDAVLLPPK